MGSGNQTFTVNRGSVILIFVAIIKMIVITNISIVISSIATILISGITDIVTVLIAFS
jgi:hypothetical protein